MQEEIGGMHLSIAKVCGKCYSKKKHRILLDIKMIHNNKKKNTTNQATMINSEGTYRQMHPEPGQQIMEIHQTGRVHQALRAAGPCLQYHPRVPAATPTASLLHQSWTSKNGNENDAGRHILFQ